MKLLLVFLIGLCAIEMLVAGVTLSPCLAEGGNSVAEIVAGQSNTFDCQGLQAADIVSWRYVSQTLGDAPAASCSQFSQGSCQPGSYGPVFTAIRTDTDSRMTVDTSKSGGNFVSNGSVICKTSDINSDTCLVDLISAAQGTCTVKFESPPSSSGSVWATSASCTMTTTSSSRGRYYCYWYRKRDTSAEEYLTVTGYSANNKVCVFNELLPTQAGRYSYRVKVTPGEVSIPASFGTNDNEIQRPMTPVTIIGCGGNDVYVESSRVTCTCRTSSVGKPPGRLLWRNATSDVIRGEYGTTSLNMMSSALSRGDHLFTCWIEWATNITGGNVTVQIGYKPEALTLSIASSTQVDVTVNENASVILTCQANARPAATLTLDRDGEQVKSSGSPLSHVIERAQCVDSGQYQCSAQNSLGHADPVTKQLFVKCSPRSSKTDLGSLNFRNQSTSVSFDVTAYPAPLAAFTFNYIGVNGTDAPTGVKEVKLNASCEAKSGVNQFTCYVIVLDVASSKATGFYSVQIGNNIGSEIYKFQLSYNAPVTEPPSPETGSKPVAIGVGIAVAVIVIAIVAVVIVVVLKRRQGPKRERLNGPSSPGSPVRRHLGGGYDEVENPENPMGIVEPPPEQPMNQQPQDEANQQEVCVKVELTNKKKQSSAPAAAKSKSKGKQKRKKKDNDVSNHEYGNVGDYKAAEEERGKKAVPPRVAQKPSAERQENQDGCIYVGLDLSNTSGKPQQKPVKDDAVLYAPIDFTRTAPL